MVPLPSVLSEVAAVDVKGRARTRKQVVRSPQDRSVKSVGK